VKVLGEHHYLAGEMPEYKEIIHQLKLDDTHFAKLYDQYTEVDKAVYRIEEGIETTSDDYLESLKKQRVMLKDDLYGLLKRFEKNTQAAEKTGEMNELLKRRDALVARLESIEKDYRGGLDADSSERAVQLENADVLEGIANVAAEELASIEKKLEAFA